MSDKKTSLDKILSKTKVKSPFKGHPKNPNYFGKNYKTPEKKIYPVNKLNEILKEPIKIIKDEDKKIKSIIKLEQQLIKIPSIVKVESNKFNNFIKNIKIPEYKNFAIILPIILFRLSSLLIANKSTYLGFLEVFRDNTSALKLNNWEKLSFISKVYTIIKDYMVLIFKNGSPLGYAETIILINLILDEIPKIILTKEYNNINEVPVLKLAKHLAQNTKTIKNIEQSQIDQEQTNKEIQENRVMLRQLIDTNNEITTNYQDILKKVETKFDKNQYFANQDIAGIIIDEAKKGSIKSLSKGEFTGEKYIKDLAKIMSNNTERFGVGYTSHDIKLKDTIKAMDLNKPIPSSNKGYKMYFSVKKSKFNTIPNTYKRMSDSVLTLKSKSNKKINSF